MEYNPRYPQPFTLEQAIALDPEVASDEIGRLQNSIVHLQRTQNELKDYLEDPDVRRAVEENKVTMASQDERIFMLKLALTHHGIHQGGSPGDAVLSSSRENRSDSTLVERNDIGQRGDGGIYL